MKKLLMTVICGLFIAPASHANLVDIWEKCGIGAMLFYTSEYRVLGIVSNITFDLGTTATTSHLASPESCEGNAAMAGMFIHKTYTNLEKQTVLGTGDHLAALTNILKCDSSVQSDLVNSSRDHMRNLSTQPGFDKLPTSERAKSYYINMIKNIEANFSNKCELS